MASPTSNPTNQPNANDPGGVIHNRTAALETGASDLESKRPRTDDPFHRIRVNPSQLKVQTASIANNSDSWTRQRKLELSKLAQGPNDAASFTPFHHGAVINVVAPAATLYDKLEERREGTVFGYVEFSRDGEVVLRTTVADSSNHKLLQCLYPEYKLTANQITYRLGQYCSVDGRYYGKKLRGILDVTRVNKHIIRSELGWVDEGERDTTALLAVQLQRQNDNPHFSGLPGDDFSTDDVTGLATLGSTTTLSRLRVLSLEQMTLVNGMRRVFRDLGIDSERSSMETRFPAKNSTKESASIEEVIEALSLELANNPNAIDALVSRNKRDLVRLAGEESVESLRIIQNKEMNLTNISKPPVHLHVLTHTKQEEEEEEEEEILVSKEEEEEILDSDFEQFREQLWLIDLLVRKVFAARDDLELSEFHSIVRECVLAFILFSVYPNLISSLLITTTSTTMNRI